jgi:hypothetical protein
MCCSGRFPGAANTGATAQRLVRSRARPELNWPAENSGAPRIRNGTPSARYVRSGGGSTDRRSVGESRDTATGQVQRDRTPFARVSRGDGWVGKVVAAAVPGGPAENSTIGTSKPARVATCQRFSRPTRHEWSTYTELPAVSAANSPRSATPAGAWPSFPHPPLFRRLVLSPRSHRRHLRRCPACQLRVESGAAVS